MQVTGLISSVAITTEPEVNNQLELGSVAESQDVFAKFQKTV